MRPPGRSHETAVTHPANYVLLESNPSHNSLVFKKSAPPEYAATLRGPIAICRSACRRGQAGRAVREVTDSTRSAVRLTPTRPGNRLRSAVLAEDIGSSADYLLPSITSSAPTEHSFSFG